MQLRGKQKLRKEIKKIKNDKTCKYKKIPIKSKKGYNQKKKEWQT